MKARGDWAFCEGINHFVLHVNIHQPWEDRRAGRQRLVRDGVQPAQHVVRQPSRDWIDYLRRCCFLLQQGTRVADVAYFIGEDAPKMTGVRQPELPPGCDFDYINAEVIQTRLTRERRAADAAARNDLSGAGAARDADHAAGTAAQDPRPGVGRCHGLGPPPSRSPSLQHLSGLRPRSPHTGRRDLGRGDGRGIAVPARSGKGSSRERVRDSFLLAVPDFGSTAPLLYTHRTTREAEIYFVTNQRPQEVVTSAAFRVRDGSPNCGGPDSGTVERPAVYDVGDERSACRCT